MGMAMCCTAQQRKDDSSGGPTARHPPKKQQLPLTSMEKDDTEVGGAPGPGKPVSQMPVVKTLDFQLNAVKFKNEVHGPFYYDHYEKFEATPELTYVEKREMPDGTYSGYMKFDDRLGDIRHGPGTLVHKDGLWRMEGIWAYDDAFVLVGIKEHNDGEVYKGHFRKSEYDGKGSLDGSNGKRLVGEWKDGRYLGRTIPDIIESDLETSSDESVKSLAGSEVDGGGESESRASTRIAKIAESIRKASEQEVNKLHRVSLGGRPASEPNPKIAPLFRQDATKADGRNPASVSKDKSRKVRSFKDKQQFTSKLLRRPGPISYPRTGESLHSFESDKKDDDDTIPQPIFANPPDPPAEDPIVC